MNSNQYYSESAWIPALHKTTKRNLSVVAHDDNTHLTLSKPILHTLDVPLTISGNLWEPR